MKQSIKTLIKILIILVLYFIAQALVVTALAVIGDMGAQGNIQGTMETYLADKTALVSLISNALAILFLLIYRHRNAAAREDMPFTTISIKEAAICCCAGICFAFTVSLLLSMLPIPEEMLATYNNTLAESTAGSWLVKLFSVAIAAPIAEEMIFRGTIYGSLKQTFRRIIAIIASCTLFSLMHQGPIWISYAFLMSLGLTLALDGYGTLLAPICLHIGFNFAGFAMTSGITEMPVLFVIGAPIVCLLFIRHTIVLAKGSQLAQGDKQ